MPLVMGSKWYNNTDLAREMFIYVVLVIVDLIETLCRSNQVWGKLSIRWGGLCKCKKDPIGLNISRRLKDVIAVYSVGTQKSDQFF